MRKIAAVLIIGALTVAACGGSSKTTTKSGSNSGSGSAFSQLYDKRSNAKIKVTYGTIDDTGKTKTDDAFTVAQDGPDKAAYTTSGNEIIVNGTQATTCSDLDSTPTCTDVAGGATAAKAQIALITGVLSVADTTLGAAEKAGGYGKESSENIAGRDADCVTISPTGGLAGAAAKALGGNLSWQSCIDKETGVVLKWAGQAGSNQGGIIATAVSVPTDADFQPPANASTVPSDSSDTTSGDGSTTPTTACASPITLPAGITVPPGINLPCLNP